MIETGMEIYSFKVSAATARTNFYAAAAAAAAR